MTLTLNLISTAIARRLSPDAYACTLARRSGRNAQAALVSLRQVSERSGRTSRILAEN